MRCLCCLYFWIYLLLSGKPFYTHSLSLFGDEAGKLLKRSLFSRYCLFKSFIFSDLLCPCCQTQKVSNGPSIAFAKSATNSLRNSRGFAFKDQGESVSYIYPAFRVRLSLFFFPLLFDGVTGHTNCCPLVLFPYTLSSPGGRMGDWAVRHTHYMRHMSPVKLRFPCSHMVDTLENAPSYYHIYIDLRYIRFYWLKNLVICTNQGFFVRE